MSGPGPVITCICCEQRGPSHGRYLIHNCYIRHQKHGSLERFPRMTQPGTPWQPTGPHGRRMLERYRELAALRPRPTTAWIAFELGVTVRSVERYAAAVRAEQAATETTTELRSEAA